MNLDSVEDPSTQDYTNYGMRLEDAYQYELLGKPKHRSIGMWELSVLDLANRTEGLKKIPE